MPQEKPHNSLHGITLENILIALVDHYGWERLLRACRLSNRCKRVLTYY
ncbi:VF530 family DNA-binding protein [Glaciimonas sp. GG7]